MTGTTGRARVVNGGTTVKIVDVHAHMTPLAFLEVIPEDRGQKGLSVHYDSATGVYTLVFRGTEIGTQAEYRHPVIPVEYDLNLRRAKMSEQIVDVHILSPTPLLSGYGLDPVVAEQRCRLVNEYLASIGERDPEHFIPVAMVPLQDAERAVREVERAVRELGMKGVQIGANVWGKDLDHHSFFPFFKKVAELDVPILVHPAVSQSHSTAVANMERLGKHYLHNIVGNPLDTTIAIARIIFSGLLDQLPNLKFCFAHAGGYAPYGIGRMNRGYFIREENKGVIPRPPTQYIRQLYFDSITHDVKALRYLIEAVGEGNVMLGSDYPFDMGVEDPVGFVKEAGLPHEVMDRVLGGNAAHLFGLPN